MADRKGWGRSKPRHPSASEEDALSKRLRDLDRRLDAKQAERASEERQEQASPQPGWGMALRLGADFAAGVILGAALGWGIDKLFGISPWGLIVFLLLGFAAGILSVLRTAGLMQERIDRGDSAN
jgi:ATP synthase protein I